MTLECGTYIFFGKIVPERANVDIFPIISEIKNLNGEKVGDIEGSIRVSQISLKVTLTQKEIEDLLELKNIVEEATRTFVDVLGYTNSCGYDIEIIQGLDLLGNIEIFGVNVSDTNQFPHKRPKNGSEIMELLSTNQGEYLRLCLSDLREAIRKPKDRGFFCYRSFECLRQYFVDANNLNNQKDKDRKRSWKILKEELDIDQDMINFIKKYADPVRHGSKKAYTAEEASKMFEITWEIIDKYIVYACNGYKKSK